jgi:hypothetical protein
MDLYSKKGKNLPQKLLIIMLEVVFIVLSYQILFSDLGASISTAH